MELMLLMMLFVDSGVVVDDVDGNSMLFFLFFNALMFEFMLVIWYQYKYIPNIQLTIAYTLCEDNQPRIS
jgi:hypothetical protein